jgi:peptidoglycan/xylan/chitin deacetylase (PgdA/CDA1 family)
MSAHRKKGRTAKVIISLGCYCVDCLVRLLMRLLGRKPSGTCVVLYYHSVPSVQRSAFARQMDLVARSTTPISLDRVPQLLPGRRYCGVTFDDGFGDTIDNAIPELQKRNIPATVFVTAGYLGQHAEWWPPNERERLQRIAPAERWRQVSDDLIRVGSHSVTHPDLRKLSEAEARRELRDSRAMLEKITQKKVSAFSFPYGEFNDTLVDWCRDAGYERVFTSRPGIAFRDPKEFATGRVPVEPTDWKLEFRLKLFGAYRWLPLAISWKRKIRSLPVFRMIGRQQRELSERP